MRNEELCLAIRETYRRAMKNHHADGEATTEYVAILKQHRPGTADADARRTIARMIAEGLTLYDHPSSTR
jgi:hypothetical protein